MIGLTADVVETSAVAAWGSALRPCASASAAGAAGRVAGASMTAAFALAMESGGCVSGLRRTTAVRNGLFGTEVVVTQAPSGTVRRESAASRATSPQRL